MTGVTESLQASHLELECTLRKRGLCQVAWIKDLGRKYLDRLEASNTWKLYTYVYELKRAF